MLAIFAEGYLMAVSELSSAKTQPSEGQTEQRDPRQADFFEDDPLTR
jgi:hypothetical protein